MRKVPMIPFLFLGLPLTAQAQVFDCEPTNSGTDGFVSTRIILGIDKEAQAGSAFDYFINQVHEMPIPVTLKQRDENSYEFSWKLRNIEIGNEGSGVLSHKVTLFIDDMRFSLRGRLHGYDNNIHASGTCTLVK